MNRQGLGIGQVFIFIVAAITFALIMIFGYKAIGSFISTGEEVAFVQFKTELETSVKEIYTEFGAIREEPYHLPGKYTQICLVDLDAEYSEELCVHDAIACDYWEEAQISGGYESVDQNVFLQPPAPVPIKVYKITVADGEGFLCEEIRGGSFTLMLEGKGDKTELSRVEG